MARVLGVSVDYLVGLTDDDHPYARQPSSQTDADTSPPPPKRQRTRKAAPVV
jgi:hypothetical protein